MRTTLTLDEDVATSLRKLGDERRVAFKKIVNDVLRAGLTVLLERETRQRPSYRTEPVSIGHSRLPNLDDIAEVMAIAEGEDHL